MIIRIHFLSVFNTVYRRIKPIKPRGTSVDTSVVSDWVLSPWRQRITWSCISDSRFFFNCHLCVFTASPCRFKYQKGSNYEGKTDLTGGGRTVVILPHCHAVEEEQRHEEEEQRHEEEVMKMKERLKEKWSQVHGRVKHSAFGWTRVHITIPTHEYVCVCVCVLSGGWHQICNQVMQTDGAAYC